MTGADAGGYSGDMGKQTISKMGRRSSYELHLPSVYSVPF